MKMGVRQCVDDERREGVAKRCYEDRGVVR